MDLFPITIAVGRAFCNRVAERKLLKEFIKGGRHTVLIAPIRYGKTSLINQSLLESKIPYTIIELTLATSVNDVEKLIIKHVSELLFSILPKPTKARQSILRLFKWLNPELILTAGGQKLQFKPDWQSKSSVDNIVGILTKLDEAAKLAKKRVAVVMDEFQQLNDITEHAIEASIRHTMQYSKNISYIFSGSHRHKLLSMFNNKNRPFYNACEIFYIDRILQIDYEAFIQKAAKEKWKKELSRLVLNKIFELTELHPSYINRLCGHFWLINRLPTLSDIEQYWSNFIESKRSEFSEDLLSLSKNQKRVIAYLAKYPTAHTSNSALCHALMLSEASVRQAVKVLLQKDYIYKDKVGIVSVLDPAMKSYINNL